MKNSFQSAIITPLAESAVNTLVRPIATGDIPPRQSRCGQAKVLRFTLFYYPTWADVLFWVLEKDFQSAPIPIGDISEREGTHSYG